MRIGIDIDEVLLDRSNNVINDSKKEFRIMRKWAGPAQHKGRHQLICITARPLQLIISGIEALTKARIIFDEYHFLAGRHKYVVKFDYLIDNSIMVRENLEAHGKGHKFIQFWTETTGEGIKKLSEALDVIEG